MNKPLKLIVGLGNPGAEYKDTRHNAGEQFITTLAHKNNISLSKEAKFFGLCGRGMVAGHDIRLLIPTTFMNLSGKAVAAMASFYKIPGDAILVAHDELDIDPGTARFKQGGGHGGHNGLRDISASLGKDETYHRLRIGIGHPGSSKQVTGFVLSKAPSSEQNMTEQAIDEAIRFLPDALQGEWQKVMNQLHSFKAEK